MKLDARFATARSLVGATLMLAALGAAPRTDAQSESGAMLTEGADYGLLNPAEPRVSERWFDMVDELAAREHQGPDE